jgi:hypothetical protein
VMKGSKLAIFNWLEREGELSKRFDPDMKKHKLDDFYASLAVLNSHKDKLDKRWFRYQKTSGNCEELKNMGLQFITGLTKSEIKGLISGNILTLTLRHLSENFPKNLYRTGERLTCACR